LRIRPHRPVEPLQGVRGILCEPVQYLAGSHHGLWVLSMESIMPWLAMAIASVQQGAVQRCRGHLHPGLVCQEGTEILDGPYGTSKAIVMRTAAESFLHAVQDGRAELGGTPARREWRPPFPDPVRHRLEQLRDVAERPPFGHQEQRMGAASYARVR
jgi:hypothetical protein